MSHPKYSTIDLEGKQCVFGFEYERTFGKGLELYKGQLISKWFFGVIDFLQKTNERIRLYYHDTSGRLVFVRFLEKIDDLKKPFRN